MPRRLLPHNCPRAAPRRRTSSTRPSAWAASSTCTAGTTCRGGPRTCTVGARWVHGGWPPPLPCRVSHNAQHPIVSVHARNSISTSSCSSCSATSDTTCHVLSVFTSTLFHPCPAAPRTHGAAAMQREAARWLNATLPWFARRGGRDHIWLTPHDEGACAVWKEVWPGIMLTHWGRTDFPHFSGTEYGSVGRSTRSSARVQGCLRSIAWGKVL